MINNKFIQVFEYQKIRYDKSNEFQKHHFDVMGGFSTYKITP